MVEQLAFRDAMARLAAAVNIITTDGAASRAMASRKASCSTMTIDLAVSLSATSRP